MSAEALKKWVDSVASGGATMSRRNLKWVEVNGGLDELVNAARKRRVHLVKLVDDKGNHLLAASREPFQTLC